MFGKMKASVTAVAMFGLVALMPAAEIRDVAPDIVATVLEFDPIAERPDSVEPILATVVVQKQQGGFHLAIQGDLFDATKRLLTQICGAPVENEIADKGDRRHAKFRSCTLLFVPNRGETVIFGFGRLPAAAPKERDRPAAILTRIEAVYPTDLRSRRVEGSALIGFLVDSVGMVHDVYIIQATHKDFAQSALQAVAKWRYSPAIVDGRAANVKMEEQIVFTIPDENR